MNRNRTGSFLSHRPDGYAVKRSLAQFVRQSSASNKQSYGEIMFIESGRKATYSPYITVSANTDPSTLWNLFTLYWKLFVPHVIICTVGKFDHHEDSWRNIGKKSWIFTKGSSPVCSYKDEASIISLQRAESFKGWKSLYAQNEKGLFPAHYIRPQTGNNGDYLDSQHTHFVFIDGTKSEVAKFRHQLLDYIGSRPIAFDSTRTKLVQIPIIVKMTTDCEKEILFAGRCAKSKHIIVVSECAKNVVSLLKRSRKRNGSNTSEKSDEDSENSATFSLSLRSLLRHFKTDEEKLVVQAFFRNSKDHNLMIYPSVNCFSLNEAIINSVISSNRHCQQTAIRLALIWDRVDLIAEFFSMKDVSDDNIFFSSLLQLALTLDRGEFLELLLDAGINVYQSLTIRMLWNLYYKEIVEKTSQTSACYVLTHHLRKKKFELPNLMSEIGLLVSQLTNYESDNFYHDPVYVFEGARKYQDDGSFTRNLIVDKSPLVPHPVRDLFMWCLFTEHNELAKVLWKHGYEQMAHSLMASVIYSAQAEYLNNATDISLSIANLQKYSKEWENKSINYLKFSCNENEPATQSQLTSKLPHLGNCSCIALAHGGNRHWFLAQEQLQRILDIVWNGSTKPELGIFSILLLLLFPFIIPFINATTKRPNFSFFNNQVYHPFFSNEPSERERANLRNAIRRNTTTIERQASTFIRFSWRLWLKQACEKIQSFFVSPRIIFISHISSIEVVLQLVAQVMILSLQWYHVKTFLLASIAVLSAAVITMNIYRHRITWELHIFWLIWYMLGLFIEDLRSIFSLRSKSFRTKIRIWFNNVWHIAHIGMTTCYFSGLIIFYLANDHDWWYASKVLFCLTLVFLYIRALKAFTVSKTTGPILQMIRRMFGDLRAFASITGLLFWAYGIILHSLENDQMPQSDVDPTLTGWGASFPEVLVALVNFVVRRPFWQLFGGLLGNATEFITTVPDFIESSATGIYVLFTSILMLNLLIAMLSFTFENVQEHSYQVWAFYRYQTVQNFAIKPCLASPFILIIHVIRLFKHFTKNTIESYAFKITLTKQELELSREFEADVLKVFLERENENENQEHLLKRVEKSQEDMKLQLDVLMSEKNEGMEQIN